MFQYDNLLDPELVLDLLHSSLHESEATTIQFWQSKGRNGCTTIMKYCRLFINSLMSRYQSQCVWIEKLCSNRLHPLDFFKVQWFPLFMLNFDIPQCDILDWVSQVYRVIYEDAHMWERIRLWLCTAWNHSLSLDVMSNIIIWRLKLYYSWDQCWDSIRPDIIQPTNPILILPLHPFIQPFPLQIIFPSLFSVEFDSWRSWTWKGRVFTSRDGSQWETARCL